MRLLIVAAVCLILACGPGPSSGSQPAAARAPAAVSGGTAAPETPPPMVPIRIAYSELTPAQYPNWVAYEAGIYAKYGLDASMYYIQSAQTTTAVIANEIDVALGGGFAAMSARLQGSDIVIMMGITTFYPYEFMVTSDIQTPADLRGKIIGISRFGSSSDVGTRMALRHFGLDPERDVTFIQVGSLAERFAAMKSGSIAAALASPPQISVLQRQGFRSLLDLASTGEQTLNNTAMASRAWLNANEATAQAFTNAILEGFHYAKNNRAFTERVIAQYLKTEDMSEAAEAYDFYVEKHFRRVPEPAEGPMRAFLAEQAATEPRAATMRVDDFVDRRFLDRAVASGLIDRLYTGQ